MKPSTPDARRLVHDGALALAEVEANGMRIDTARLDETIRRTSKQITKLESQLKEGEEWKVWRKRFGGKASLGSRQQLAEVLKLMDHKTKGKTRTGRSRMDQEALERLDIPIVKTYVEVEKLKKLRSTYLKGVKRETVDGFLHPSFNLHLARTFRSSSDHPNFQNIPIRDKQIGKLIRRCFIPREGHEWVSVDYSALEFRIAACFWRDDAMVAYASDPDLDIHRDMAAECYMIEPEDVPKQVRFYAKNQFVFPTLYGSYYVNTARNLWNTIGMAGLTLNDGTPLEQHLMRNGIKQLGRCNPREKPTKGTFEQHVKGVEEHFHRRFPQWSKRREAWWKQYEKQGWFRMMTGFVCSGIYSHNDIYNYPIQGPAFHCLLWSLIQLVREMKQKKMRSLVIGQIHDSIEADVHKDERTDYLRMVKRIMTKDIREAWPWIIVPLEVEAEVAETNWWEKSVVEVN